MNTAAKREIFAIQVQYLYAHLSLALLATFVNSLVLVYFFIGRIEAALLWGWLLANIVLIGVRLGTHRAYRASSAGYERDRRYFIYFCFGIVASALLWGSTAFVFLDPSSFTHQLFLVFICGGMAAGAIGSSGVRFELYLIYQLFLLFPFVARFWSFGGELYVLMALMLFLYMVMMIFSAFRLYKTLLSSFHLSKENSNLASYLEEKKQNIEKLNADLHDKVDERNAAQEGLRHALEDAKRANRAKDVFLASMSHELRTPLNAILGFSQILMVKKDVPAEVKGYVDKILLSGNNLLSLVNTILDFSKIEAGKMEFCPRRFKFSELMDEVLVMFESGAKAKGLKLLVTDRHDIELVGDYQLFKQVMTNLLSNAMKFSYKDTSIAVDALHDAKAGCYRISVRDSGIGIREEDVHTLFDPFTMAENGANSRHRGTGLGLAISKEIVEHFHGGRIWVCSEPGKGSEFFVEIPEDAREDACKLGHHTV